MDVAEIFDKFGVDAGNAMVIDRAYVPNSATIAELTAYSLRKKKALNIVQRRAYVSIINSKGWLRMKYSDLDEESVRALEEALEKADSKNRSYCGQ